MISLALGAAWVGFVHSLSPAHWAPVALMARTKRWSLPMSLLGALTAASGHILISLALGFVAIRMQLTIVEEHHEAVEHWTGVALMVFGLGYGIWTWRRHSHCHGHEHHGPKPRAGMPPFFFLFILGLSPCVAALPLFVAAVPFGTSAVLVTLAAFTLGVLAALVLATVMVRGGLMKLDHPILEHYGESITGAGIALVGLYLWLVGH